MLYQQIFYHPIISKLHVVLLITIVVSIQDHFAGLLREALPSSSPPVAAANMRLLCDFAHMVYDTAAQSSTTEADVRLYWLSLCLMGPSLRAHTLAGVCLFAILSQTWRAQQLRCGGVESADIVLRPAGNHDHRGPVPGRCAFGQAAWFQRAGHGSTTGSRWDGEYQKYCLLFLAP